MLHTSVGSFTSSSSSLRKRRLGEIAEDAEDVEEGGQEKLVQASTQDTGESTPGILGRSDTIPTVEVNGPSRPQTSSGKEPEPELPKQEVQTTASKIQVPDPHTKESESGGLMGTTLPPNHLEEPEVTNSNDVDAGDSYQRYLKELSKPSQEPRKSTQSSRPSTLDIEKASLYSAFTGYRVKKKVGPRPSLDQPGRSRSSGYAQLRSGEPRPVSTLPSSIQFSTRAVSRASASNTNQPHRPKPPSSVTSSITATANRPVTQGSAFQPPPSLTAAINHIPSFYRPPLFNTSSSQSVPLSSKPPPITPEKQRLMRALQLRKKQMAQSQHERENRPAVVSKDASEKVNGHALEDKETDENASSRQSTDTRPDSIDVKHGSGKSIESDPLSSPISPTETSEAPSTKGSSFTEMADNLDDENEAPEDDVKIGTLPQQDTYQEFDSNAMDSVPDAEAHHRDGLKVLVPTSPETPGTIRASTDLSSQRPPSGETAITPHSPQSPKSTRKPNLSIHIDKPRHSSAESTAKPQTADSSTMSPSERRFRRQGLIDPMDNKTNSMVSNISDDDAFMEELQSAKVEEAKPITVARSPATPIFPKGTQDLRPQSNEAHLNPNQAAETAAPSILESYTETDTTSASVYGQPELLTDTQATNSAQPPGGAQFNPEEKPPVRPRTISMDSAHEATNQIKPQSLRSVSGRTLPQWPPAPEVSPSVQARKVSVSSGISKRIKALEMFSGRDSTTTPPPTQPTPMNNSPSKSWKSRMSWTPNQSPPNMTTMTPPPSKFPYPSPDPTPELKKVTLRPTNKHISVTKTKPTNNTLEKTPKTISVTARIVRNDDTSDSSSQTQGTMQPGLTLHRSELTVERKGSEPEALPKPPSTINTAFHLSPVGTAPVKSPGGFSTKSKNKNHRRSMTASLSSKLPSSETVVSRLSLSSITRPKMSELSLARSASDGSSFADPSDEKEKKESRRSRILRRMSGITSSSKRGLAGSPNSQSTPKIDSFSATIVEDGEVGIESQPRTEDTLPRGPPPHVVDIGDINVQFPDSLLWKHRFMRVDAQGYLILTPPTMETNTRNISRKFHLSEFKKPTIPDLDRQELPHSILLDFHDGSCLQCACESRYAQMQALQRKS